MSTKRNGMIPNAHFHKDWDYHVKCHFNQPGKKKSRRTLREKKLAAIAPRPAAGFIRPVVRCPTFKYNTKERLGRGFTLSELKAAKISHKLAKSIGISVDHRRRNLSAETQDANVQRLKSYQSLLVRLPKGGKVADLKVPQLIGDILPIKRAKLAEKARAITEEEKNAQVFLGMRRARADARLVGIRQKKKDDKEKDAEAPKKEKAAAADE